MEHVGQMKTWRQGSIGKLSLPNLKCLYIKCLKYPLGLFYDEYEVENKVWGMCLFKAFVGIDTLKQIEKIGFESLSKDEKDLGSHFSMHYVPGTIDIAKIEHSNIDGFEELIEIENDGLCTKKDLQDKLERIKSNK
jgi:hypothetical protein